jgi:DHA1 family inner membrane transport protein
MTLRQLSNNRLGAGHIALLAAGTFTLGLDGFMLSGLLPQIAADLSVSVAQAGQLTTAFSLSYAVSSPVIAAATGRWDRRVVLVGGMALFLAGMVLQAAGTSFGVVFAGRMLAGIGAAGFQSTAYAVAGILSTDDRRPRALAMVATGTSVSIVLGVPFGVLIGQAWGWRTGMWLVVAFALATAALLPLLPAAYAPWASLRDRLGALGDRSVLAVVTGTVVLVMPGFLVMSYLPVILGDAGSGLHVVGALLALGAGQVAGNQLVGRVVGRFGALRTVTFGAAGLVAVFAGMGLAVGLGHLYAVVVGLLTLVGALIAFLVAPQQSRYFLVAPKLATVALGLNGSAIYVGAALGAAVGGLVVAGTSAAWLPVAGTLLAGVALTITTLAAPERRQRTEAPVESLA